MAHHHSHSVAEGTKISTLWLCIIINLLFVAIEAVIGWKSASVSLLSDAGHNLSDALGLLLSLLAVWLLSSSSQFAKQWSARVSVLNASLLLLAVFIIVVESIRKLAHPEEVNASAVMLTALAGIVINAFTAYLLKRGKEKDINLKLAYLHAATDALVSVGVVISGSIIHFSGWNLIDPIVSLLISVVIAVPAVKLFFVSLRQ